MGTIRHTVKLICCSSVTSLMFFSFCIVVRWSWDWSFLFTLIREIKFVELSSRCQILQYECCSVSSSVVLCMHKLQLSNSFFTLCNRNAVRSLFHCHAKKNMHLHQMISIVSRSRYCVLNNETFDMSSKNMQV